MKNLKLILAVVLLMNVAIVFAQQQEVYVSAESGLSLRDQPDVNGKMLTKLSYGEAIGVLEETDKNLVILDGGEKISGKWVKVETRNHIGYVFNGYLSPNKIARTIRLKLDKLNVEIKNVTTSDYKRSHNLKDIDSTIINVDKSDSAEGKNIVLIENDYKHVSIFQRYENSFSFMSSDPNCKSNEPRQFNTEWKPLKQLKSNSFETLTYTKKDWVNFIKTATKDLKDDVENKCGKDWLNYVKTIKNIKDYPISISKERVFIKLILTDFEDNITEKIIEFDIPES
ncbi:hypothetical protein FBALC1_16152 [Flavobacteriales bacterium ALC-1]|nr:hypothetical protein FBALC1_16152 [Flavobacteriales bacterium ALC-1]